MSLRAVELTPSGTGAVSVLEVTGAGALEAVEALAGGKPLRPGCVTLARLRTAGEELDEAHVAVRGPDHLELCLHGNPVVVSGVMAALGATKSEERPRQGDRAWASELLADAPCEAAARIALDQLDGALGREVARLLAEPDPARREGARELVLRSRAAMRAVTPARVVLAGPVNAGKSTLFNVLVGSARALVASEQGTTRDAVHQRVRLGEWPVELIDTAGERRLEAQPGAAGEVERAGMALGRSLRPTADLVVWLAPPGTQSPPAEVGERRVVVASRIDELEARDRPRGGISALREPQAARAVLARVFREALELPQEAWEPGRGVLLEADALAVLTRAMEGGQEELERALAALA